MHITFVTHSYPRWTDDVAGNFVHLLARAVRDRGHRITVLAPADQGAGGAAELDGIAVRRVRYAAPDRETLAYTGTMVEAMGSAGGRVAALRLLGALARELRALRQNDPPDVVHAHWWIPGGVAAWLAGRSVAPLIVTMHGTDVRLLRRGGPMRVAARAVLRRAAGMSAVSTSLAEQVAAATGTDRDAIIVQAMPVALHRFQRLSSGGDGVLTVGRLTAQKRMSLVVDAVAHLHGLGRRVPLTIIGDGPERPQLEVRARERGIADFVRFLGEVRPDALGAAMGDPDVFAFAACDEGLGLAAAEAFFLGVPVVVMRGGGGVLDLMPEGAGGKVVPDGNVPEFADAIGALADDPSARAHAAEHGHRLRARLAPEVVAQRYEQMYFDAVGGA